MNNTILNMSRVVELSTFLYAGLNGRILDVECNGDSNGRYSPSLATASDTGRGTGFMGGLTRANAPVDCNGCGILGTYGSGLMFAGASWSSNFPQDFGTSVLNAGYKPINDLAMAIDKPANYVGGETSIDLKNGTGTEVIFAGDKLLISGNYYTVTTTTNTMVGGAVTGVGITPGLAGATTDGTVVTVVNYDLANEKFGHAMVQASAGVKELWDPLGGAEPMGNDNWVTCWAQVLGTGQLGFQINSAYSDITVTNQLKINNGAGYASGTATINLDATSVTGSMIAGDHLIMGTAPNSSNADGNFTSSRVHMVTAPFTAAGNAFTGVTILPELGAAVLDNQIMDYVPRAPRGSPVPGGDDWLVYIYAGLHTAGTSFVPKYRTLPSGTATNFQEGAVAIDPTRVGEEPWIRRVTRTIPAASQQSLRALGFQVMMASATITPTPAAPTTIVGYQIVNKSANGIAVHQRIEKAGCNFKQMYEALNACTPKQHGWHLEAMTYEQSRRGLRKMLLRVIQGGHNDQSISGTSLNGIDASTSVEGMKFNFREYLRKFKYLDREANRNGYTTLDPNNVYTIVMGPHRLADNSGDAFWSREQDYVKFRRVMAEVCSEPEFEKTHSVWDVANVHTFAEANAAGWYDLASPIHMAPEGWFAMMEQFSRVLRNLYDMQAANVLNTRGINSGSIAL